MRLPLALTPHTVWIRDLLGTNSEGEVYGEPRRIRHCKVEDRVRTIRDREGSEIISSSQVFVRPTAKVPQPGSLVTLWKGTAAEREATVQQVAYWHHPPAPTHYVVYLG